MRAELGDEISCAVAFKNDGAIYRFERIENFETISLGIERTPLTFQRANRRVTV